MLLEINTGLWVAKGRLFLRMWLDLGCVGQNVYMCAHGDPPMLLFNILARNSENSKPEPGLLSHCEGLFVRRTEWVLFGSLWLRSITFKYLDIGNCVSILFLFWAL